MVAARSCPWRVARWFDGRRILVETELQRAVLVILAIAASVFLSGTFMGINSLQSVWAKQGHYEELCATMVPAEEPPIQVLPDAKCQKQAMKLLLLSHVATGVTFAVIPIAGILTDWQGARRVYIVVISILALGNLIALIPNYWTQFVGTTLMSAVGPCMAFTLLTWAQLVPGWTRWIVAIITASFPGGAFFLGQLRIAVLHSGFSISGFFAIWLLASLPAIYLFVIWPRSVGKPYAASHPLLMLAYFDVCKKMLRKLNCTLPDDADHTTMVELEDRYTDKLAELANQTPDDDDVTNDEIQVKLDFDALPTHTANNQSDGSKVNGSGSLNGTESTNGTMKEGQKDVELAISTSEPMVTLDSVKGIDGKKENIKDFKWMDQLNSWSIVFIQAYFLLVCVWLAVVANLGAFRMTFWARKVGGDQATIDSLINEAKVFLPQVDSINVVTLFTAPVAAITMRTVGVAGLSLITHIIATISALLCLSTSWNVQILNFWLFAVVRGLMYPFAMMFLIQTCGRRHLGLLWAMTVSGAGPTDFIRTFLLKYWLYRPNAWDVLNGVQLIPIAIAWIWPIYVWLKQHEWDEEHPEPLS